MDGVISPPQPVEVKFKKLHEDSIIPTYATDGSACFDIPSYYKHDMYPGRTIVVGTGLAVEIPRGFMLELRPRSGLSTKGVILVNSPATIDSDYRGELKVILHNFSSNYHYIYKTDRIAQARLIALTEVKIVEVERLTETERAEGGLGSTGS